MTKLLQVSSTYTHAVMGCCSQPLRRARAPDPCQVIAQHPSVAAIILIAIFTHSRACFTC